MTHDEPVAFTSKLSDEAALRATRELELTDAQAAEALSRMKDSDLMKVAEFIRTLKGIELKRILAENEYRVVVRYDSIPSVEELRSRFYVVAIQYARPFVDHPRCQGVDRTNGERIVVLRHFDDSRNREDVLSIAEREGCRVAVVEEALAFIESYPDVRWPSPHSLNILGSRRRQDRTEPRFYQDTYHGRIGIRLDVHRFEQGRQFLFVRK